MCYISLIILTLTFEQCKNWIFVNKHIHTHTHTHTSPGVYFPWCVLPLVRRWQCAHNYSTVTYVGLTRRSRFSLEVGEGCLQGSDVVGDVVVGRHRLHERSLTVARRMGSAKKGTLRVYHGKHRGREGKNVEETALLAKVGGY